MAIDKIERLKSLKEHDHDTPNENIFSYLDLKKSEEEIANEMEKLHESADGIWEKRKEHTEASKYGNYIQLDMG